MGLQTISSDDLSRCLLALSIGEHASDRHIIDIDRELATQLDSESRDFIEHRLVSPKRYDGAGVAAGRQMAIVCKQLLGPGRHVRRVLEHVLEEALEQLRRFRPERALLVDMTHDFDHEPTNIELAKLKESEGLDVQLAYDGQRVAVDL